MTDQTDDLRIRSAQPGDAPVIAEIWFHGWRDGHLGHVQEDVVRMRTTDAFAQRAEARIADTRILVVDGNVVGFTMVVDDEVEQVYVSPVARNRCSERAPFRCRTARGRRGHAQAWLAVVPGNLRARRFYEKQGWVDDGALEYPAVGVSGVVIVPTRRYIKELAPPRTLPA